MQIHVNGEIQTVSANTVQELVAGLGLDMRRVAIERNREIVPKAKYDETGLKEGDQIEIVKFIGGG